MLTIDDLIEWAKEGRRSVQLDITSQTESHKVTVWAYDFEVQHGCFVGMNEELPTTYDLVFMRRAELSRQLKELDVE